MEPIKKKKLDKSVLRVPTDVKAALNTGMQTYDLLQVMGNTINEQAANTNAAIDYIDKTVETLDTNENERIENEEKRVTNEEERVEEFARLKDENEQCFDRSKNATNDLYIAMNGTEESKEYTLAMTHYTLIKDEDTVLNTATADFVEEGTLTQSIYLNGKKAVSEGYVDNYQKVDIVAATSGATITLWRVLDVPENPSGDPQWHGIKKGQRLVQAFDTATTKLEVTIVREGVYVVEPSDGQPVSIKITENGVKGLQDAVSVLRDEMDESKIDRAKIHDTLDGMKIEEIAPSSDLVKEEYAFFKDGLQAGKSIKVYKDQSLKNVSLNDQTLTFTYTIYDEATHTYSEKVLDIDLAKFIQELEVEDGLEVKNGKVYVKLANNAETRNYLHFVAEGDRMAISLDGIENFMKEIEDERQAEFERLEGVHKTSAPYDLESRWGLFDSNEANRKAIFDETEAARQQATENILREDERLTKAEGEINNLALKVIGGQTVSQEGEYLTDNITASLEGNNIGSSLVVGTGSRLLYKIDAINSYSKISCTQTRPNSSAWGVLCDSDNVVLAIFGSGNTTADREADISGYPSRKTFYFLSPRNNSVVTLISESEIDGKIADVNKELEKKQDILTIDNTPTKGSINPVSSGGVNKYIDGILNGESTGEESVEGTLVCSVGKKSSINFPLDKPLSAGNRIKVQVSSLISYIEGTTKLVSYYNGTSSQRLYIDLLPTATEIEGVISDTITVPITSIGFYISSPLAAGNIQIKVILSEGGFSVGLNQRIELLEEETKTLKRKEISNTLSISSGSKSQVFIELDSPLNAGDSFNAKVGNIADVTDLDYLLVYYNGSTSQRLPNAKGGTTSRIVIPDTIEGDVTSIGFGVTATHAIRSGTVDVGVVFESVFDQKITELENHVNSNDLRITALENAAPVGDFLSQFDGRLYNICRSNVMLRSGDKATEELKQEHDIELLIITDTHLNPGEKTGNALQEWSITNGVGIGNTFPCIDAIVHLGDVVNIPYEQNLSRAIELLFDSNKPVYVCIGNHDTGAPKDVDKATGNDKPYKCAGSLTMGGCYDNYIKPIVDKGWLKSGEYQSGKPYYYHDFTDRKTRLIVLYEYDNGDVFDDTYWELVAYNPSAPKFDTSSSYNVGDVVRVNYFTAYSFRSKVSGNNNNIPAWKIHRMTRAFGQAQMQWLVNTLNSTPNYYGVIIATHMQFVPDDKMAFVDCRFNSKDLRTQKIADANDVISKIVNAFINKTSVNFSVDYSSIYGDNSHNYSVSANFSSAKGTFFGYIGGHAHKDMVFKHNEYNGQYCVSPISSRVFATAAGVISDSGESDYGEDIARPVNNTPAFNCYTVVSFAQGRMAMAKVGNDTTIYGVHRDIEVIDIE